MKIYLQLFRNYFSFLFSREFYRLSKQNYHSLLIIIIGALILMYLAFYNGYPLLYPDSGTYISAISHASLPQFRAFAYCVFTAGTSLYLSLFTTVFLQSVILSFCLYQCSIHLIPYPKKKYNTIVFFIILILLCLTTGVAIFAGQIMADITTPILLLTLILIIYTPKLSLRIQVVYLLLLFFSIRSHSSHLLILLGTLIMLMLMHIFHRMWQRKTIKFSQYFMPRVHLIILSIVLCMLSGLFLNSINELIIWKRGGDFSLISRGGSIFLFARLMDTPIVTDFLATECPKDSSYRLCQYRKNLAKSANDFLWIEEGNGKNHLGILGNIGGWNGAKAECSLMLRDIFSNSKYIKIFILDDLKKFITQLFTTSLGDNIFINNHTENYIKTLFPSWEKQLFENSKTKLETTLN